jgi:hypothetical protein
MVPGAYQTTYGAGSADAFIAKLTIGTPTVTGVSPNVGSVTGETTVTITGINFTSTEAVFFGLIPVTSCVVNSDTQITAISLADQFTYQLIPTTTTLTLSPNLTLVVQTYQIGTVINLENLRFKDTHIEADKAYTYFVVSVDDFGNTSQPAKVVIRGFAK